MKENILGNIVEVEGEIANHLKEEKARSEQLLSSLRKEAEKELLEEETRLQNALAAAIDEARAAAEEKADAIQQEAKSRALALEKISDEILKNVIRNHLSQILQ